MESRRGGEWIDALSRPRARGLLAVLIVGAAVLGARLASLPLLDPDEAKHAQAAREMLEAGRWIEPVLYGQPYHHKPSLLYVLIGACYRAVGVGELGARLVPALAGLLTLALVYVEASRRRVGDGWLAALLLAASSLFFAVARFTNFDGLFTLVTFAAVVALSRWVESEGRCGRALVAGALFTGLGVLVKGPAAAVLTGVPAALLGFGALRGTGSRYRWLAVLVFSAVVASWLLPAAWLHPQYVFDFLWVHNVQRYSVDADVFHPEPFWFFVPVLVVTLLPWSPLVPSAVAAGWRRSAADRFFVAYAAWVVLFFSLSNGKLATYVLPAYPPLALLVARHLNLAGAAAGARSGLIARTAGLLYLASPLAAWIVLAREEPGFEHLAAALLPVAAAGAWVLVSRHGRLAEERTAVIALAAATLATYLIALGVFGPSVGRLTSDRDLVAALRAVEAKPDVVLVHKVRPFSFLFYSDWPLLYKVPNDVYRAALTGPGRVWVLTKDSRLATFPSGDPPVALREIARNHRHVVLERLVDATTR